MPKKFLKPQKALNQPTLVEYFSVNLSFIKNMSGPNKDDFTYLNEQEWRIVHTYSQEESGNLVSTGVQKPRYRIPVQLADVRLVVFPDDKTRTDARSDPKLNSWFQDPAALSPILLSLEECGHF